VIDETMIKEVVAKTFEHAAIIPSKDGMAVLRQAFEKETDSNAKRALEAILDNLELAKKGHKSMCQTYATPAVHINLGANCNLKGIDLIEGVREGCRLVTSRNFMRPSVVHPITRKHFGGNVGRYFPDIEVDLVPNSNVLEIIAFSTTTLPASRAGMWLPTDVGKEGKNILKAIVNWAIEGGAMLCPPLAVGVGIGGDLSSVAKMTRKSLLRGWDVRNSDPEIAAWENRLLDSLNKLGIGPFGLGGDTFALAVNIEMGDTHASAVPIGVEYYCWASALRRAKAAISADGSVQYT
jgi:fumarate hydratase subunit alpha